MTIWKQDTAKTDMTSGHIWPS